MGRKEDEADDSWTEFGAQGPDHRGDYEKPGLRHGPLAGQDLSKLTGLSVLVDGGVRVVPVKPTEAMIEAARATVPYDALCDADVEDLWSAMLMIAPASPPAETGEGEAVAWMIGRDGAVYKKRSEADKHVQGWHRQGEPCDEPVALGFLSDPSDTERMRALVEAAFIAGATAVHEDWNRNPGMAPSGDPEFDEAAWDYARAALAEKEADQ